MQFCSELPVHFVSIQKHRFWINWRLMKNKIEKLRFSLCFCLARTRWGASSSKEKLRNTFKCAKCHLSQNHDNAVYKEFLQPNETECTLKTKDDSCENFIGKLRFRCAIARFLSVSFFPTVHSLKTFPLLFTFFFFAPACIL